LFYPASVPIRITGMSRDWLAADASLPTGWRIAGVVLEGERWLAWAEPGPHAGNPKADRIEGRDETADRALVALARKAREVRGSASG
jgi:hypothetical protein